MKKTNLQMMIRSYFLLVVLSVWACGNNSSKEKLEVENMATSCVSFSFMKPPFLTNRSYEYIGHHDTPEVFCDSALGYSEILIVYSGISDSNQYKLEIGLSRYSRELEKEYQRNLESPPKISSCKHNFESKDFFQHTTTALFSKANLEDEGDLYAGGGEKYYAMRLFTRVSDEVIVSAYYEVSGVGIGLTFPEFKKQALKITASFKLDN